MDAFLFYRVWAHGVCIETGNLEGPLTDTNAASQNLCPGENFLQVYCDHGQVSSWMLAPSLNCHHLAPSVQTMGNWILGVHWGSFQEHCPDLEDQPSMQSGGKPNLAFSADSPLGDSSRSRRVLACTPVGYGFLVEVTTLTGGPVGATCCPLSWWIQLDGKECPARHGRQSWARIPKL